MKIEEIHPELRSVFRFVPSLPFQSKLFLKINNALERITPEKSVVNGVPIEKELLAHSSVRVFEGKGEPSGAGLLWIHGGGLAASLTQMVSDSDGVQPAAQALFCPMLDDRTAAHRELDSINHRVWNNKSNRAGWSAYLGHPPGALHVPAYAVPARREDLSRLPPAWIGVGDIDLFYEEDCLYSQRLRETGVDCQLHIVPMAPHAFETIVPKASITRALYSDNYRFLRESLSL